MSDEAPLLVLGRYAICDVIGIGGMATVHVGRLLGPVGFSRTVAIKRMHAHLATDPEFVTMFLDEARLAAHVQHANVVSTLDVVSEGKELLLVMEYVAGESFARVLGAMQRKGARLPLPVVGAVVSQTLHGLHAVHEARGDDGRQMGLVHRDVSPDNVIVGRDGLARLLDFGIAKATERGRRTQAGKIKGKVAYMAPEQVRGQPLDRRVDIFGASAMLWEALTGHRLFDADTDIEILQKIVHEAPLPPSSVVSSLSPDVDALVKKGLAASRAERFATAREMALEVERVLGVASPATVGQLVEGMLGEELDRKSRLVDRVVKRTASMPGERTSVPGLDLAQAPKPAAAAGPFAPLASVGATPTERSAENAKGGLGGTEVLVLPNLEIDVLEPPSPPKPEPAALGATMISATKDEAPPLPPPAPLAIDTGAPPARPPLGSTPEPLPVLASLEIDRAKNRPARPPPRFELQVDPRREAVYEPRALRPLLLPLLLIILVLGAGGAYLALKRPPKPPPTKAPSVAVADPAACEVLRRRVRGGGQPLGLSRDGWVAELWLRPKPGESIDASKLDLLALQGSDPASKSEVAQLSAKGRQTTEGLVVRLAGPVVAQAFDLEGAGKLSKAADLAFENSKAEAGALYLKCAHLDVHDVGLWFRGRDLPTAGSALLFAIGSFSDMAVIREPSLYPPGTAPGPTLFEDLKDRLQKGKVKDLQPELERYGATVAADGQGGIKITFPVDNGGAAMRGSRVVADVAGIEAR